MSSELPQYLKVLKVDHSIKLSMNYEEERESSQNESVETLQKEKVETLQKEKFETLKKKAVEKLKKEMIETLKKKAVETLERKAAEGPTNEVDQERPFPTDYDMANLSYYAYKDAPVDKTPQHGWKFLLSAKHCGITNGYYGDVFYNANQQQIVVAHRGTKLTNLGALYTDYKGIYLTKVVPQVNSAMTMTNFAIELVKKLNGDHERKWFWQLSFTGHSLGGWLAQLSTFYAKYLTIDNAHFIRNKTDGYHAHCVTFDSPGCKPMLQKIKDGLTFRHFEIKDMSLSSLDITNYLHSPNLINTTNFHVGKLLQFKSAIDNNCDHKLISKSCCSCCQYVSLARHTLSIHKIHLIMKCFDENTGYAKIISKNEFEIDKVIDFPASGSECSQVYHNNDVFDTKYDSKKRQIRYRLAIHYSNVIDFKVFSKQEINFLTRFGWSLQIAKYSNVVLPKHPEIDDLTEKLRNVVVNIDTERGFITCKEFNECQKLIRMIKFLFHSCQVLNELSKTLTNDVISINQIIYKYESNVFVNEYLEKIDGNDTYSAESSSNDNAFHLTSFFDSNKPIFFYKTPIGVQEVRHAFKTVKAHFSKDNYLFLSIGKLLLLNVLLRNNLKTFSETVREIKHKYLILIIDLDTEINEETVEFMNSLSSNVDKNCNIKVVLVAKEFGNQLFDSFKKLKFDTNFDEHSQQFDDVTLVGQKYPIIDSIPHHKEEGEPTFEEQLNAIKLRVFKADNSNRRSECLITEKDRISNFDETLIDWFIRVNVDITQIVRTQLTIVAENKSQLILSTLLFADVKNCRKYINILDHDDDMRNIYEFADLFRMFLSRNYSHLALLIQSCKEKCVTGIAKNLKILSSQNKLSNYDGKFESWINETVRKPPFIMKVCSLNSLLTFVEDSIFCLKPVNDVARSFCSIVTKELPVKMKLLDMYKHINKHFVIMKD